MCARLVLAVGVQEAVGFRRSTNSSAQKVPVAMSVETETLLDRSLAARLAFGKVLHARLAAESCASYISADLVEDILRHVYMYLEPVVVPHTSFAGAHTGNTQYFEYTDDALRLITVCWLSVSVTATRVPAGRYTVVLELTAEEHQRHTLSTAIQIRKCLTQGAAEPTWEDYCPTYEWDPQQKGRGELCICEVQLSHTADIRVSQQNISSNWKGGTQWHRLILEPQPLSSPPSEPNWCATTC